MVDATPVSWKLAPVSFAVPESYCLLLLGTKDAASTRSSFPWLFHGYKEAYNASAAYSFVFRPGETLFPLAKKDIVVNISNVSIQRSRATICTGINSPSGVSYTMKPRKIDVELR